MWQYALWGLIGAAANRALLLLEASERAKKWPWTPPDGPGGGLYATSVGLHLGIATAATAALATTTIISNGFVAFGFGAGAPVVVKKACRYAIRLLPPEEPAREIGGGD